MEKKNTLAGPTHVRKPVPHMADPGFDPEMLFVECASCGNPILWEQGRSTEILLGAGIDPLELDAHCLLVTDGCPRCCSGRFYHVQVYRVENSQELWTCSGPKGRIGHD